jgi:hypothetical protein
MATNNKAVSSASHSRRVKTPSILFFNNPNNLTNAGGGVSSYSHTSDQLSDLQPSSKQNHNISSTLRHMLSDWPGLNILVSASVLLSKKARSPNYFSVFDPPFPDIL